MNRRKKVSPNLHPAFVPLILVAVFALLVVMVVPVQAGGLLDSIITPTIVPTSQPLFPRIFPTRDSSNNMPNVGWLGMPADYNSLASSRSLALLSGELIFHGLVNASSCPDGGLMRSGAASPCGEMVAHNAVILWQNQFDEAIYNAAISQGIPPYLLKNVIAQESQFWPGSHPTGYGYSEYGLGHMTTMGADTLLRWNRSFSSAFCLQVYSEEACRTSYALMPLDQQAVLRGAAIQRVNADCGSCPGGIDLRRARESILFIAATLQASRSHAEWYVEGLTGRSFARLDPSDAWRFTLVGYNGGPGCLSSAISRSQGMRMQLSWKSISESLDQSCESANKYVDNVKHVDLAAPEELLAAQYDSSRAAEMVADGLGITFNPISASSGPAPTETPTGPADTGTETASSPTGTVDPASETATPTPTLDPAFTPSATLDPSITATETATLDPSITATETPTLDPSITATATATLDPSITATATATLDPSITATVTATLDPSITATETPTLDPSITATPTATTDPLFTPIPTFTLDPSITATLTQNSEPTETPIIATPTETLAPPATLTATPFVEPTPIVTPPADGPKVEIIVKFYDLVPNFVAEGVIASAGGQAEGDVNSNTINVVAVPQSQVEAIVSDLQGNLLVDYVEPNYTVQAFYTPNDPDFVLQTNLTDMQVPQAWDVTHGQGVVVAVIDTGLDFTHLELISNLWANPGEMGTDANGNDKSSNGIDDDVDGFIDDVFGWNFVDNNNDFTDLNGHGTHSAGIIAASMDNSLGIVGVAPEARIMALKVLDSTGHGTYAQVAQAIIYAVDHGARVINLGFGGQADSQALRDATDYAYSHGVVVVAAAGNGGSTVPYYPAANPNVIAVVALDPFLNLTSFSAYGYTYSVAAPGVSIYSTLPGGEFGHMSGTSMAAAEVSGVAALLRTQAQFDTVDKVRYAIFGSARDLGDYGHDLYFGYGLVQAYNALGYDPSTFSTPTPVPTPGGNITPTPTSSDTGVDIQGDAANASISNYTRSCPIGAVFGALGGTAVPAIQVDDGVSAAIPLGFDFWYMGTRYTNVYASSNGWLSFTDPLGNSYPNNNAPTLATGLPRPMLAPLWDDLGGTGGTASYTTTGVAPNRTFTFEWSNWRWQKTAAGPVISFRVELFESTGVARFRYVQNGTPVTGAALNGASVGLTGSNTGAGNFVAVNPSATFTLCPPTWSTATDPAVANAKPANGRILAFTPNTPANPTNLRITATTSSSATLTWTDNANNENGYVIYTSTDGVNFTTQAGAVAGWQSAEVAGTGLTGTTTVTGLSNVETLYWRIYAVSEGRLSAVPAAINPPTALTFTNIAPTSVTLNWIDTVNDAGYIILNSTNGTDYTFVTQVAADASTYNASGLTAGTSYAWRVQAINPRAVSSAIQGSVPVLTITAPATGSSFLQTDTITFTATATDAIDGNIAANVQWSSDLDGALGAGGSLSKTGMSLGQHTVTASVTNSGGLTVTATLTVIISDPSGNVPPLLVITAPSNNSAFAVGTNITFTGTASDIQDGNLSAMIDWQSNINGNLGTGATVSTSALSIGTHIITARVTDSGGLTSTRTIRVFVTTLGGALPPELTILSPANGAIYQQGMTVGMLGNATIRTNADISNYIQWSSNLDGVLASNTSSFGITTLSVGTHTITATVTDANTGLTATATVTIVITALPVAQTSPHGAFAGSTDTCVVCHDPHSASSWGPLVTSQDSPYENNKFCVSCHNTPTQVYSTHSNKDAIGALEQPFELLCIQCHDPHGNQPNLSNIRATVRLGTLPTTFDNMPQLSGPAILFTARTGAGSFDDGSGTSALCLACHQSASNPGAPMSIHNGGAGHNGGNNYTGQDCTSCHPHSLDATQSTNDGFTTTCRACHSQPQDLGNGTPRRQIVGLPNGSGGNNNDFVRASHHVAGNDTITDADCQVCHEMTQHKLGKVRLLNQDAPGVVYTLDYLKSALDDPADYDNFCLSCHDSNGKGGNTTPFSDKKLIPSLNTSLWAAAQHNVVKPLYGASCLDCHSNGHGSNKANMLSQYTLTAPWDYQFLGAGLTPTDVMDQEEDFCSKCHNATGTGINVQPAFTTYPNTATRIFTHNVSGTYATHNPGEVFGSSFGLANRHIECNDCHGPHATRSGASVAPTLPRELTGATGVEPVYGGGGGPVSYNFLTQVTAEYQVCFKCHSSYTTLPGYVPDGWNGSAFVVNGLFKLTTSTAPQVQDSRDLAREFNPSAASFHPVTATGKNPNMPNSFVAGSGWSSFSRLYCSTCHTDGDPALGNNGPHGSPCLHLLRDAVNDATCNQYTTMRGAARPNNNEICFTCHRADVYNATAENINGALTYFRNGVGQNLHWKHVYDRRITCYTCHDSHGSEQFRLINFNTSAVDIEPGYDSQSAWSATFNPNGTTLTASCYVDGGGCHSAEGYTP